MQLPPIPINGTISIGIFGSLDGIDRFTLLIPSVVGENVTSIVHVSDGAIVCAEQMSF